MCFIKFFVFVWYIRLRRCLKFHVSAVLWLFNKTYPLDAFDRVAPLWLTRESGPIKRRAMPFFLCVMTMTDGVWSFLNVKLHKLYASN